jgi:hypothetical protein
VAQLKQTLIRDFHDQALLERLPSWPNLNKPLFVTFIVGVLFKSIFLGTELVPANPTDDSYLGIRAQPVRWWVQCQPMESTPCQFVIRTLLIEIACPSTDLYFKLNRPWSPGLKGALLGDWLATSLLCSAQSAIPASEESALVNRRFLD